MTDAADMTLDRGLTDEHWEDLLQSIKRGNCTPMVGAGASVPTLPLAHELARELAEAFDYPMTDAHNLARVTQYLAIRRFGRFPKDKVIDRIGEAPLPDFGDSDDPHGVMADLPLPLYITTNYDHYLAEALKTRNRDAQHEYCRWSGFDTLADHGSVFDTDYRPTVANPLVYHLHGHIDAVQSMVLTEQDYLDFLVKASGTGGSLLPAPIRIALASNALLFVGYSMTDWTFRVLFRSLIEMITANTDQPAVSIQVPPGDLVPGREDAARAFLTRYHEELQGIRVRMYWGTARQFAGELSSRWAAFA
jgi:SIR2-like domain